MGDNSLNLVSIGYSESTSEKVYGLTGNKYDFTRCQKPSGKIYGTRFKCKPPSVEIEQKGNTPATPRTKRIRIGKNVREMNPEDLQKLLKDPRVKPHQVKKIQEILESKRNDSKKSQPGEASGADGPKKPPKEGDFRREVESDKKKLQERLEFMGSGAEALAKMRSQYATMREMYRDPGFQTQANRARMLNMRVAIWKGERELREKVKGQVTPKDNKAVQDSPKYNKTPGSSKPIAAAQKGDLAKLQRETDDLSKEFDTLYKKTEKSETRDTRLREISARLLRLGSDISSIQSGRPSTNPPLKDIYEQQGFNAKPELVPTVSDLRNRADVLRGSNGSPIIMYRGVTTLEFSDQFKGLGSSGGTHYPGRGIFGNGTYASAASDSSPSTTEATAIKTAKAYAGNQESLNRKVTAFALRADSKVATFPGGDQVTRERAYDKWFDETIEEARKKTGYYVTDIGEAAAALGYHAYQAPQRGEDFYVILNRGAVIAAMNSGVE